MGKKKTRYELFGVHCEFRCRALDDTDNPRYMYYAYLNRKDIGRPFVLSVYGHEYWKLELVKLYQGNFGQVVNALIKLEDFGPLKSWRAYAIEGGARLEAYECVKDWVAVPEEVFSYERY